VLSVPFFTFGKGGEKEVSNERKILKKPKKTVDYGAATDRLNYLREQVLDSKTQMMLFKYLIRKEGVNASYPKITVKFTNELASRYKVYSVQYTVNNEIVYTFTRDEIGQKDTGVNSPEDFQLALPPGQHSLGVELVVKGNESGVFSYLNSYKVTTKGKSNFKVDVNTSTKIEVTAYEKGWFLTDFKDRPDLNIIIGRSLPQNEVE
jgi:hypothetical protein